MTKKELDQYGQTPEGRQQAFLARQTAGTLWQSSVALSKGGLDHNLGPLVILRRLYV
jgi:hypothetical protein